jgi:hypothetical protein
MYVKAPAKWNRADIVFALFGAFFLYLLLFILPGTPVFYEEDHLIFANDAWRMMQGEVLYRDIFQITFPGTQVLYLGFFLLFGAKFWIINAVILLQGLAQFLISLAISKRLLGAGWHAYVPSCIFLFLGFRWFGLDGSHRMLSPVFIWLAILILLGSRSIPRVIAAGVLCGIASYFTQQRGLLAVSAIAFFLLIEFLKDRNDPKRLLLLEAILLGSFGGALFVLLLPFLISAGLIAFFESTILFIGHYVRDPSTNYATYFIAFTNVLQQGVLISAISLFYYLLIPLIYIATFVFLWRKRYVAEVFLIAVVGFFLAAGTIGPNPGRIFQISIPGSVLLVWLLFNARPNAPGFARIVVVSLVVFGGSIAARIQANRSILYLDAPTGKLAFLSSEVFERYAWLNANANINEYVFEVYEPAVNFPLLLRSPVRIPFLLNTGYTPESQVTEAIQDLGDKQPRFILWDKKWTEEIMNGTSNGNLAPLYDYMKQKYRSERRFTPYSNREMELWKRID